MTFRKFSDQWTLCTEGHSLSDEIELSVEFIIADELVLACETQFLEDLAVLLNFVFLAENLRPTED